MLAARRELELANNRYPDGLATHVEVAIYLNLNVRSVAMNSQLTAYSFLFTAYGTPEDRPCDKVFSKLNESVLCFGWNE